MLDFTIFFPGELHPELVQSLRTNRHALVTGAGNGFSKAFLAQVLQRHLGVKQQFIMVDNNHRLPEINHALADHGQIFQLVDQAELNQRHALKLWKTIQNNESVLVLTTPHELLFSWPLDPLAEAIPVRVGQHLSLLHFYEQLIDAGYKASDDAFLKPGTYYVQGSLINIMPIEEDRVLKIELSDQNIEQLLWYDQQTKKVVGRAEEVPLFPVRFKQKQDTLFSLLRRPEIFIVWDELDALDPLAEVEINELKERSDQYQLTMTAFPESDDFFHLRYLSVLKYYTSQDFINDLQERFNNEWKVVIYTKNKTEIKNILRENEMPFFEDVESFVPAIRGVLLVEQAADEPTLSSFQNPRERIAVLTDRELFRAKKTKTLVTSKSSLLDFLMSLKQGDYVVHADHGVGRFVGIDKKTVDGITKEYLKIEYAENDKLFIPTDQADKISKYIGDIEHPKLTRLDSTEWSNIKSKVKKETERIAKELLVLYANRQLAKGHKFVEDDLEQKKFEETFPYVETPGQARAIRDVKEDMEKEEPMDRLVCGDVGFGKTEVAMRAAFKAVRNGKQVALISPVTILADQHYKSFRKRMDAFGVRIDMLSRFKSMAEQKTILKQLAAGNIDIVIGTHRLLQKDVQFKDLGLLIIDEEQKFGVKQKEELKKFRCNVDVLTLTATPIPRTLNMSLNKLRDISTILTPPPGRLPIITEVRKYSDRLVRDAILHEKARGGQIFFLHNRVQTIEGIADKLRTLIPEATFVVAHGQMEAHDLEQRIMEFKEGKYDVLVSSTIIENGIDLSNANTLIVNNADQFGLSQLYQLRGRVGRGRKQAYTYLLYNSQKLDLEAKKRLRAIVEAAELGSGFQVAMKDLEIRGAGEIIGVSQHGTLNAIGVSHFIRLLNQTIDELKAGRQTEELTEEENIFIELPLTSYIPDTYISDYKDKINAYQRMSSLAKVEDIIEYRSEMEGDYGKLPDEVGNLFKVLELKVLAKSAGLKGIRVVSWRLEEKIMELYLGKKMTAAQIAYLLKDDHEAHWMVTGDKLKINVMYLGLDWVAGLKEVLLKLIDGLKKNER